MIIQIDECMGLEDSYRDLLGDITHYNSVGEWVYALHEMESRYVPLICVLYYSGGEMAILIDRDPQELSDELMAILNHVPVINDSVVIVANLFDAQMQIDVGGANTDGFVVDMETDVDDLDDFLAVKNMEIEMNDVYL